MPNAYKNNDIKIIKVFGDNAKDYLNNIITNNTELISSKNTIYSCLLTPQGKFLADFFITSFYNEFHLMTHSKFHDDLIKGLSFYKLRSKVTIEDVSSSYKYYFMPQPDSQTKSKFGSSAMKVGQTIQEKNSYSFIDPRIASIGIHIVTSNDQSIESKNLQLFEGDCLDHFLANGILSMNFIKDLNKFYPLENNLHLLNAIDFKKGCYVGQELTARMKLRNKIPRTILPFIIDADSKLNLKNTEILEDNVEVGEIIFQYKKYLFGHITLRKLSKNNPLNIEYRVANQIIKVNSQEWIKF